MLKGGANIWDPVGLKMEVIREKVEGRGGEIMTWVVKGVVSFPPKKIENFLLKFWYCS